MTKFKCWEEKFGPDDFWHQEARDAMDAAVKFAKWSDQQGDGYMVGESRLIFVEDGDKEYGFTVRTGPFGAYTIIRHSPQNYFQ